MRYAASKQKILTAALLSGTTLGGFLPLSQAKADCSAIGVTPSLITIGCTGATVGALPITALPSLAPSVPQTSGALILGSDGNTASITNTTANAVDLTATGPAGNFISLDTGNLGAPSSITGLNSGVSLVTTNGADILIGQNSAGGQGLNANVTGQDGFGILAFASGEGNIAITTAPGTEIASLTTNAIYAQVENGDVTINVNGTATNPTFAGYSVSTFSSGSGNINIGGSGNIAQGILALSSGSGAITIGGTGSIINPSTNGAAPFGLLTAVIDNSANNSDITITRSGIISVQADQAGLFAATAGSGNVSIIGIGDVTAGLAGIGGSSEGGNVTITPAGSVTGSTGIIAETTGVGQINISTAGNITGKSDFGIETTAGLGTTTVNIGSTSTVTGALAALKLSSSGGDIILNNAGTVAGSVLLDTSGFDPTVNNTGTITGGVNVVGDLLLNNFGTINGNVTATGLSTLNNAGRISLVNGVTTDILNTTTFNGQGGVFAIDVNPTSTSGAQRADQLQTTNLSGNTDIVIHVVGAKGLITNPIPIVNATNVAPGTTLTVTNPPSLLNYSIDRSGGTFNLVSTVNTNAASATPSGIDSVLTAVNTGFFQNASAFIAEPPNPGRNQWNGGPWVRFAGGANNISVGTSADNPMGTAQAQAKVHTTYNGFQTGVDLGLANIEGTGWNTHLGVTAGQVLLRTNDLIGLNISSAVSVPFIGIYGAVTGHNFFADFQVREDLYDLKLTNPVAFLYGSNLNGRALAVNASAGYRFDLPNSWFIEPSAAFMYSKLHMNSLRVGIDPANGSYGSLIFNPFTNALGRFGLRAGTAYVVDQYGLVLQPFATLSLWREFADNTHTTFVTDGGSVPLSVTRIGTFGQVGAGISGQVLQTGLLGFVRGDYRFGDHIDGYAVVGGLRYQF
jgi:hypothetical protein